MDGAAAPRHEPGRAGLAGPGKTADPAGKEGILRKKPARDGNPAARRAEKPDARRIAAEAELGKSQRLPVRRNADVRPL